MPKDTDPQDLIQAKVVMDLGELIEESPELIRAKAAMGNRLLTDTCTNYGNHQIDRLVELMELLRTSGFDEATIGYATTLIQTHTIEKCIMEIAKDHMPVALHLCAFLHAVSIKLPQRIAENIRNRK